MSVSTPFNTENHQHLNDSRRLRSFSCKFFSISDLRLVMLWPRYRKGKVTLNRGNLLHFGWKNLKVCLICYLVTVMAGINNHILSVLALQPFFTILLFISFSCQNYRESEESHSEFRKVIVSFYNIFHLIVCCEITYDKSGQIVSRICKCAGVYPVSCFTRLRGR